MPHLNTCWPCALANMRGERLTLAAATPAFLRKSRRFITDLHEACGLSNTGSITRSSAALVPVLLRSRHRLQPPGLPRRLGEEVLDLGVHAPQLERRPLLQRGVEAGVDARDEALPVFQRPTSPASACRAGRSRSPGRGSARRRRRVAAAASPRRARG